MRMTKKVTSIVLAVLMVVSMITVMGAVSASAYTTISELDAAIRAGGTVVLDNDFTFNGSLYVPSGVTTEIDLAGHKLQSVNKDVIYNDGTLTITDSVGNGQVIAQEACVVTRYGGTTTINCKSSTTFTSKDNGVFMGNGTSGLGGCTWNIKQGTFNGNIESAGYIACGIYAPNDDTWNISGGTFNITNGVGVCQRAGTVNITGGTFNVTGNGSLGKVGDSRVVVPTGTAVVYDSKAKYPAQTDETDKTTVTGGTFNTDQAPVAQVKEDGDATRVTVSGGAFTGDVDDNYLADGVSKTTVDGVKYVGYDGVITNQSELAAACVNGGKYVLGESFTSTGADVADGVDLELNLADKTLTVPAWGFCNYGKLTVDGTTGKITAPKGAIDNYGELILKGGTIEGTNTGTDVTIWNNENTGASIVVDGGAINAGGFGINNLKGCSVTMNSGSITAGNTAIATYDATTVNGGSIEADKWGISVWGSDADLTVNGGSIEAGYFGISGNGSNGNQGYEITVNGGYIQGDDVGIYHPNFGSLEVNGGTIEGATGIYVKAGETAVTAINGATVKGTGAAAAYTYSGNGCNPTGDAVVIDNCGYPGGAPNVSIAGGNFISDNAKAVGSYQTGEYPKIDKVVSGGTFSSDVSDVAADGYVGVQNANGTYGVGDDPNPLNALETATVTDNNAFELNCKYLKGTLLGVQKKTVAGEGTSTQEGAKNIRFVAVLDRQLINEMTGADDYGFVLAKVKDSATKTFGYDNTNINHITVNSLNGEKKITAKGTYNNVCGNEAYGDPEDPNTDYKYVTCAVNNMSDSDKVIARFYFTKGGKTYYAKYAGQNYKYTGCISTADAT